MTVFFQVLIVFLLLAAMIMILLGISQLSHGEGFEEKKETELLLKEVDGDDHVISSHNIFHKLMEREKKISAILPDMKAIEKNSTKQKKSNPE